MPWWEQQLTANHVSRVHHLPRRENILTTVHKYSCTFYEKLLKIILTSWFSADGLILGFEGRASSFLILSKHAEFVFHAFSESCHLKWCGLSFDGIHLSPREAFGVPALNNVMLDWFSTITLRLFPWQLARVGCDVRNHKGSFWCWRWSYRKI